MVCRAGKYGLVLLALALVVPMGCKRKKPKAQLQAIETILQESTVKERDHKCGLHKGKPADLGGLDTLYNRNVKIVDDNLVPVSATLEQTARNYLITVPNFLMSNLTGAGGQLVLGSKEQTVQACSDCYKRLLENSNGYLNGLQPTQLSGRLSDLKGCWCSDPNSPPAIYASSNKEDLNDGLLPLFAYLHLERLNEVYINRAHAEGKIKEEEKTKLLKAAGVLGEYRVGLVKDTFADLKAAGKLGVVKRLKTEFGLPEADTDLSAEAVVAIGNMLIAESFDSYYCSAESYAFFSGSGVKEEAEDDVRFSKTFATFRRYADQVVKDQPWHRL